MTAEDTAPEQGAHGPALAGHGHGKGLLNGPHREMIIVVCSVIGVGLTFAMFRKGGSSGSAPAQKAAMGYPGSSAVLSSGQVAGFDQAAVAGLQTQLANVSDQVRALSSTGLPSNYGAGAAPSTPQPLAAGLTTPTYSGNYWHMGTGMGEFESDGSMLVYSPQQWQQATATPGYQFTDLGNTNVAGTSWTSTANNLVAKNQALTAAQQKP